MNSSSRSVARRLKHNDVPLRLSPIAGLLLVALIIAGCSSDGFEGNDPPGLECEYDPFGGRGDVSTPDRERLADFDYFVRVLVTGHSTPDRTGLYNIVTVEESVFGPAAEGDELRLHSDVDGCLETGESYYLRIVGGPRLLTGNPWAVFPVINNRITLHPDMRKDELIGDFHGLDPVLFKRQFVELTGRTDIEVD